MAHNPCQSKIVSHLNHTALPPVCQVPHNLLFLTLTQDTEVKFTQSFYNMVLLYVCEYVSISPREV